MPKKKASRKKRKPARKTRRKIEFDFDQRMEHFGDEVQSLGKRFGKRMEEKGCEWDSWFHRTFGIVGPLISSIFGLVILAVVVWFISFVNLPIGSAFMSSIYAFFVANMGLFFLIFLFFSYTSYFSRACPKGYLPLSPIVIAIGITIAFWIVMHAINIVNLYVGDSFLYSIVFYIGNNLFWIFGFFLIIGYLVLWIKVSFEKPMIAKTQRWEDRIAMRKTAKKPAKPSPEIHRLYRSGKDKILGGVCGGIAEYLGVDPVIIRLLWIVGSLAWGAGIILYIIAWIIIPRNPEHKWD